MKKKLKFDSMSCSDDVDDEPVCALPVYETPPPKYSAERIVKILLQPDKSRICYMKPTNITRSATYVVDVRSLQNADNIKKDEFGIWRFSGSHPQYFKIHEEEDGNMKVERCCDNATGVNVVLLRRLHCTHPSNSDFRRLICFLSGIYGISVHVTLNFQL